MHTYNVLTSGSDISQAKKVLVLLHGRGGNAMDMLAMAQKLNAENFAIFAPQAGNNTWYPLSFLAPPPENEPWLSSALGILDKLIEEIGSMGIEKEKIYIGGFSQGACLTAEFVTRHAEKLGGVIVFTGGLIGDRIYKENYKGDFAGTPIFIGTNDPDPHVPVVRVLESVEVLKVMHAKITTEVYKNMGHTISQDELGKANELVFNL